MDEEEPSDTWPAFVDLFAATSLLFVTLIGVFVYVAGVQRTGAETTRQKILARLASVSENGRHFAVDSSDRQFVRIVLNERATFPQGRYEWNTLRAQGRDALEQIGGALNDSTLRGLYREVRVLGHTDRMPYDVRGMTNWELSAARAAVVARYLVNWVRVDPCVVSATGRGPYFPVSGDSLELNRRIEIQVVPRLAMATDSTRVSCDPAGDGARAYAAEQQRQGITGQPGRRADSAHGQRRPAPPRSR